MSTSTTRLQAIAAMHAAHDEQLRRLVARRANANDATIDDAGLDEQRNEKCR